MLMSGSVHFLGFVWISKILGYGKWSLWRCSYNCSCMFEAFLHKRRSEKVHIRSIFGKFQKWSKKYWNMSGTVISHIGITKTPKTFKKPSKKQEKTKKTLIFVPYFGPSCPEGAPGPDPGRVTLLRNLFSWGPVFSESRRPESRLRNPLLYRMALFWMIVMENMFK